MEQRVVHGDVDTKQVLNMLSSSTAQLQSQMMTIQQGSTMQEDINKISKQIKELTDFKSKSEQHLHQFGKSIEKFRDLNREVIYENEL